MAIATLNGVPGRVWVNGTGKVQYQLIVSWHNSCAACCRLDHAIASHWAVPFHPRCRCQQHIIYPGESSLPFFNFRSKFKGLPADAQDRVMGVGNAKLVKAGLVTWDDVIDGGRVRTLAEVVARAKLGAAQLARAGVRRADADAAVKAAQNEAEAIAGQVRLAMVAEAEAKAVAAAAAAKAVADRLAAGTAKAGPLGAVRAGVKALGRFALEKLLGIKIRPAKGA